MLEKAKIIMSDIGVKDKIMLEMATFYAILIDE